VQQLCKNHRVTYVGDNELVEAEYAGTPHQLIGDTIEGIGLLSQACERLVYLLHEAVKMNPPLLLQRQRIVKKVDQPGFATADSAPDIEPPWRFDTVFCAAGKTL
jgi:hypothetical protein